MACNPELLRHVTLFVRLDDEERAVLAGSVEMRSFADRETIYLRGHRGGRAYVVVEGRVRVTTIDEDGNELIFSEPGPGDFFGFASLLEGTAHKTTARAAGSCRCLEIEREDLEQLVRRKPEAGLDMLSTLSRHIHAIQDLARSRSIRSANELIEERATLGDRLADAVARFGGSWNFIVLFALLLTSYVAINNWLRGNAWDPYPYILLNLFLSMLAAVQAPVIMMSQNRQDAKDRLRAELDFQVNRKAEHEVQIISKKLSSVELQMEALIAAQVAPLARREHDSGN